MSIGLDFILKAKTELFTRGMASANNSIKDIKQSLREFDVGNGLKQALGVGGIIAAFRYAITEAQELRDVMDEVGRPVDASTRSIAEMGDTIGKMTKAATGAVSFLIGGFTQLGGVIGSVINRIRGVSEADENMAAESQRNADRQEKARDEDYKNAKGIIDKRKSDEHQAAEERKREADRAAKEEEKRLDDQYDKLVKIGKEQASLDEKKKKNARELLTDEQQISELTTELEKKNQAIFDYKKHTKLSDEDQLRLIGLQNDAEDIGVEIVEKRLKLEEKIAEQKQLAAEAAEAVKKGQAAGLTQAEQAELSLYITSKGKSGRIPTRTGGTVSTSGDFTRASDAELQEKITRTQREIARLQTNPGSAFEFGNRYAIDAQTNILSAARRELANRDRIRRDFAIGGEAGARSRFMGDPLEFDRVFSEIVKGQSLQEKATQSLENIERALTKTGITTVPIGGGRG